MPTQIPRESTDFFGDLLFPFAHDIFQSVASKPLEEHSFPQTVHGAIIASNGRLTENYEYIQELRLASTRSRQKESSPGHIQKQVVIFGAGRVAAPLVECLHRHSSIGITVACQQKELGDNLAKDYPGVESVYLNAVGNPGAVQELVAKADVAISILPRDLHPIIAKACIREGTHMVTASYAKENLTVLHQEALDAGITILNEVGLDPGIDHLLALECMQDVKANGGRIISFESFCGGLPAPEFSDNPLRYKFSWSPRSALINTLASAKYLSKGQTVEIKEGGDLMGATKSLNFLPGFHLEGYPNGDSTKYAQYYGIPEAVTLLRGTIRYKGFTQATRNLQLLGLLDPENQAMLHDEGPEITWRQFVCNLLGLPDDNIIYENLKTKIVEHTGTEYAVELLEDLGLLDETKVIKCGTPLDTLTHHLSFKLNLENNERDLVILRHDIGISWPDNKRETKGINFVVYGDINGHSAMAKTVGYPAAIATKMVLDGEIQERGVILPFAPEIYRPILSRLRAEGLNSTETSKFH